jgi:hypothetical protein
MRRLTKRLSVAGVCALATGATWAEAQSATDSTAVVQRFALAVAQDLIGAATSPSPTSLCLLLTSGDAPTTFLATLRDAARSRLGSRLAANEAVLRYHVTAQHFAITPREAALEVLSTLARPRERLHQQWRVVYFAVRDTSGWHVRPGVPREVAHSSRVPTPASPEPCLTR